MNRILRRVSCVVAVSGALLLGAVGAASAAPSSSAPFSKSTAAPHAAPAQTSCPQPGQRVKTPTSPSIYLIGPDGTANWIPSATEYANLWDTWNGIFTVDDATMSSCFGGFWTMSGAKLAKVPGNAKVYVYDVNHGGYRWIASPDIFTKYAFAASKIKTQATVSPVSAANWDF